MERELKNQVLISLIISGVLLFFVGFFNYISALYSDVDLFKIDLAQQPKKKKKKIVFVAKNSYLLFVVICFLQVIASFFFSDAVISIFDDLEILSRRLLLLFLTALVVAFLTEILVRYIATKTKHLMFNEFLLGIAYAITRFFYPFLRKVIKPKKKIFTNSEKDIIRFMENLATENVLEANEAQLVKAAFNFDDLPVSMVFTPRKKVIFLTSTMSLPKKKSYRNF
jgi:CBS domain containing-hemolysin-like protein